MKEHRDVANLGANLLLFFSFSWQWMIWMALFLPILTRFLYTRNSTLIVKRVRVVKPTKPNRLTGLTDTRGEENVGHQAMLKSQLCLRGQALESVRGQLLIPETVPFAIETLRKLYGRPEILIHSILHKLRNLSPPKADNLSSVVTFGLAIQNAVQHMTSLQLVDHLSNPVLMHELVEKLPASMKLEWSRYKRRSPIVNLATFWSIYELCCWWSYGSKLSISSVRSA